MSRRALAISLALLAVAANLLCQSVLINGGPEGHVLIAGLADLRPEWNRGVSFSLLVQNSEAGCYLLIAFLAVVTLGAAILAWRTPHFRSAAGYGAIVGGAIGNLIDRVRYCAVFDFLALHIGSVPLFVCNLADIFISIGAVLLVLDALLSQPAGARNSAG